MSEVLIDRWTVGGSRDKIPGRSYFRYLINVCEDVLRSSGYLITRRKNILCFSKNISCFIITRIPFFFITWATGDEIAIIFVTKTWRVFL